jgi:hypothetical protein
MRQIHPVGFHEKFVASGVYQYGYIDDASRPLKIIEYWSLHELPDQSQILRIDWDAIGEFGQNLQVELLTATPDIEKRIQRFDVYQQIHRQRKPNKIMSSYIFFENFMQIRHDDERVVQEEELELPSEFAIDLSTLANLTFFSELASSGKTKFLVFRRSFVDSPRTSKHYFIECAVIDLDSEELIVSEKSYLLRKYNFKFPEHDVTCWFDEHHTLIRYELGNMCALLTQYARRPKPKS